MKETLEHTLEYLYAPVWPDNAHHVIEQGLHNDDETGFMLVNRDTYAVGFINLTLDTTHAIVRGLLCCVLS